MTGSQIKKIFIGFLLAAFIASDVRVYAQTLNQQPVPGTYVALRPVMSAPLLKGLRLRPDDNLRLDFIMDQGRDGGAAGREESLRLLRYFLAGLTVPEEDLWVNLSPYEKDRIVPEAFGVTEMGRDLLAQDYLLKQLTASLIYPEGESGKKFWAKVYEQARKRFGTSDIPLDTFNKVWIVPAQAEVYETAHGAYVLESRLKVMLDSDYLAMSNNPMFAGGHVAARNVSADRLTQDITNSIMREIIIPLLEKEVNEGENFIKLRQVYNSLILAMWFKEKMKSTLLGQAYADKRKTDGIDIADKTEKEKIWAQYVESFKKGVYNLVKEETDAQTGEVIPRKYFSGGVVLMPNKQGAYHVYQNDARIMLCNTDKAEVVDVKLQAFHPNNKSIVQNETLFGWLSYSRKGAGIPREVRRWMQRPDFIQKFSLMLPLLHVRLPDGLPVVSKSRVRAILRMEDREQIRRAASVELLRAKVRHKMFMRVMRLSESRLDDGEGLTIEQLVMLARKADGFKRLLAAEKLLQLRHIDDQYVFRGKDVFLCLEKSKLDDLLEEVRWLAEIGFNGLMISFIVTNATSLAEKKILIPQLIWLGFNHQQIGNIFFSSGDVGDKYRFIQELIKEGFSRFNVSYIITRADARAYYESLRAIKSVSGMPLLSIQDIALAFRRKSYLSLSTFEELWRYFGQKGCPYYEILTALAYPDRTKDALWRMFDGDYNVKHRYFSGHIRRALLHKTDVDVDDVIRFAAAFLDQRQLKSFKEAAERMVQEDEMLLRFYEQGRILNTAEWARLRLSFSQSVRTRFEELRLFNKLSQKFDPGLIKELMASDGRLTEPMVNIGEGFQAASKRDSGKKIWPDRRMGMYSLDYPDKFNAKETGYNRVDAEDAYSHWLLLMGMGDDQEEREGKATVRINVLGDTGLIKRVGTLGEALDEYWSQPGRDKARMAQVISQGVRITFNGEDIYLPMYLDMPIDGNNSLSIRLEQEPQVEESIAETPGEQKSHTGFSVDEFRYFDYLIEYARKNVLLGVKKDQKEDMRALIEEKIKGLMRSGERLFTDVQARDLSLKRGLAQRFEAALVLAQGQFDNGAPRIPGWKIFELITNNGLERLGPVIGQEQSGSVEEHIRQQKISRLIAMKRDGVDLFSEGQRQRLIHRGDLLSRLLVARAAAFVVSTDGNGFRYRPDDIFRLANKVPRRKFTTIAEELSVLSNLEFGGITAGRLEGATVIRAALSPEPVEDNVGFIRWLDEMGFARNAIDRILASGKTIGDKKRRVLELLAVKSREKGFFSHAQISRIMLSGSSWADQDLLIREMMARGFLAGQVAWFITEGGSYREKIDFIDRLLQVRALDDKTVLLRPSEITTCFKVRKTFDIDKFTAAWALLKETGIDHRVLLKYAMFPDSTVSMLRDWFSAGRATHENVFSGRFQLVYDNYLDLTHMRGLINIFLGEQLGYAYWELVQADVRKDEMLLANLLTIGLESEVVLRRLLVSFSVKVRQGARQLIQQWLRKEEARFHRLRPEMMEAFNHRIGRYRWDRQGSGMENLRLNLSHLINYAHDYLWWRSLSAMEQKIFSAEIYWRKKFTDDSVKVAQMLDERYGKTAVESLRQKVALKKDGPVDVSVLQDELLMDEDQDGFDDGEGEPLDNDRAMTAESRIVPGGIDLTKDKMNIHTQGEVKGAFVNDQWMLQQITDAKGLVPVIMGIDSLSVPLSVFLGAAGEFSGQGK